MSAPRIIVRSLIVLSCLALSACGQEWEPGGIGPSIDPNTQTINATDIGASVLVDVPVPDDPELGALGSSGNVEPRVVYLAYADGKALPRTDVNACSGTAPKFVCKFAPTLEDCQRQIQSYLDKWYADLNIVFTLTRPTSGRFYTEVISSGGGAWCGLDSRVAGVAPFLCKDIYGGVAYTFMGGESAKQTAIIIAQEQAHLVGLEHTVSDNDLLQATICSNCDGFENANNDVKDDRCGRTQQNSYDLMKERVGAWKGGSKPAVFACKSDTQAPTITITEPGDGAKVGHDFTVRVDARDECNVAKVTISVSPQKLNATSMLAPYQWDLTNISGNQTIIVTAYDDVGHKTSTSITVAAGTATAVTVPGDDPTKAKGGCTTAAGTPAGGAGAALLGLAMLFGRRRRR